MGSKNRIAKYILPIMLAERTLDQWWVEPFVGGANMIDKVHGNRIGADANKYVIALLKEMQTQIPFNPPHIGEKEFKEIKDNMDKFPDWLIGFAGFNLTFGAKFLGNYSRAVAGDKSYENEVKYNRIARNNLLAQQGNITNVNFIHCDYKELKIPSNSLIYCDPPYEKTTKYTTGLNHSEFWEWCRDRAKEGHTVFVSEYNAPDDFKCIWEKDVITNINAYNNNNKDKKRVEKLFRYYI